MPGLRTKTRHVEENGLKGKLVEERWHFLVLALLTERAITAGRSRATRDSNGHANGANGNGYANGNRRGNGNGYADGNGNGDDTAYHAGRGGFPSIRRLRNARPGRNGGLAELGTNGGPESGANGELGLHANGEAELPTGRSARLLSVGVPTSWSKKLRTNGAGTNGAHAEAVAHNGAGQAAGISRGGADAWEFESVQEAWEWLRHRLREYFASDHRRTLQTALGLLWLLDGALQLQSFMYSGGFTQTLLDTAQGQPGWLASSMRWAAHLVGPNLAFFNTLFALTQVAIGIGLLHRRTVKTALPVSLAWAFVVWWVGEGFGMLFTDTASPLTGAPGAVFLYAIVCLLAWPSDRPGGLLGARGAKAAWATLWLVMAWSWLLGPNSSANATSDAINSAPSGLGILSSLQHAFASAAKGNGLIIAVLLSLTSAAIGLGVALDFHPRRFLKLAMYLSLAYWVIGQGFGGIFTGTATDPNTAPLFALFAFALWPLCPARATAPSVGSRFGPALAEAARRQAQALADSTPRQTITRAWVGAAAVAIVAVGVILATSGGGSSSPGPNAGSASAADRAAVAGRDAAAGMPVPGGPAASGAQAASGGQAAGAGQLQPQPAPGPLGPEGLPIPSGPPLAAVGPTASGKAVDGIPSCVSRSQVEVRRNVQLVIFVQGFARQIPAGIGIPSGQAQNTPRGTLFNAGNCFSALHTVAADGMIQLRAPTDQTYTLGNFFDIWGQPFNQDHVGPATGRVTVFLDGQPYTGNPRNIPLNDANQIQLDVGKPLISPKSKGLPTDL